jgi:hypothetical protein
MVWVVEESDDCGVIWRNVTWADASQPVPRIFRRR